MKSHRAIYTVCLGVDRPKVPLIHSTVPIPCYLITDSEHEARELGDWERIRVENSTSQGRELEARYLSLKYHPDQLLELPKSRVFVDCSIESLTNIDSFFEHAESHEATLMPYVTTEVKSLRREYIKDFARGSDYPVTIFDSFHLFTDRARSGVTAFDGSVFWYRLDEDYGNMRGELAQHLKFGTVQENLVVPSILLDLKIGVANGYVAKSAISTGHSEGRVTNLRFRNKRVSASFSVLLLPERILRRLLGRAAFQPNKVHERRRRIFRWLLIKADFRSLREVT